MKTLPQVNKENFELYLNKLADLMKTFNIIHMETYFDGNNKLHFIIKDGDDYSIELPTVENNVIIQQAFLKEKVKHLG